MSQENKGISFAELEFAFLYITRHRNHNSFAIGSKNQILLLLQPEFFMRFLLQALISFVFKDLRRFSDFQVRQYFLSSNSHNSLRTNNLTYSRYEIARIIQAKSKDLLLGIIQSSVLLILTIVIALSFTTVRAEFIEVNSGQFSFTGTGGFEGGGRGHGFRADADFIIDSVGIFADLVPKSFEVVIYSSLNGSDTTGLLARSSAFAGGTGTGWHDIDINFSFNANEFYIVNWRPSDLGEDNWLNSIDYYSDSSLPQTIGPLTLIDGIEGTNAETPENLVHPTLRYNVVPEPATIGMWVLVMSALGLVHYFRCAVRRR